MTHAINVSLCNVGEQGVYVVCSVLYSALALALCMLNHQLKISDIFITIFFFFFFLQNLNEISSLIFY